jgi:excisionase family DNA binding protein
MKAKTEDSRRKALIDAAQLLAKALVERFLDTPESMATLALGLAGNGAEEYLTRQQAADELKIHPTTLDRLNKAGKIRCERAGVRGVRYLRSEIDRYLNRRTP